MQFFQLVPDVIQIRLGLGAFQLELCQSVLCCFERGVGAFVCAEQLGVLGVRVNPSELEVALEQEFGAVLAVQVHQELPEGLKQLKLDGRVVDEDPTASLDRKFPADNQLVPGVQVVAFKPSSGTGRRGEDPFNGAPVSSCADAGGVASTPQE